jgi:hypothetical protein
VGVSADGISHVSGLLRAGVKVLNSTMAIGVEKMRIRWEQPVMLACKASGQLFIVTTTKEAFEFLTSKWPISSGKEYLTALEICDRVSTGAADRERARLAFIAAAEEAGFPVTTIGVADTVE